MKKLFLLFVFAMILSSMASAQVAQSVYFELGGPGIVSFNFDTRFSAKEDGLGGRIGLGGYSEGGAGAIYIPVGLNYLLGKDNKHYFEIGAGVTPVIQTGDAQIEEGFLTQTFGHLLFGYRMQPLNGGYTFRVFVNPVFGNGYFIPYYLGISFGYKF